MASVRGTTRRNKMNLQFLDGYPIIASFPRRSVVQTLAFTPREGDVFVAGFPKSGTTWLQYIVWDIVNFGAPLPSVNDIWMKEFPHLEMVGTDGLCSLPSPRLLKTLLNFKYAPYHPSAKYIHITRNPFDACVSFYTFIKMLEPNYQDATFDEFFQSFINGEISNGSYVSHVSSWYKHRGQSNFLFISYEEMKNEPQEHVLTIAKFIDRKYYERLVNDPKILKSIVENTTFSKMRNNCDFYWDLTDEGTFERQPEGHQGGKNRLEFFRKGIVGDWKAYFSAEQQIILADEIREKLPMEELIALWESLDLL